VQNLFLVADAARRISRQRRGEHDDPVLRSDVDAVRGGTTKAGIRVGVMAGTLDILQRYYAGARIGDEVLYFDPQLLGGLGGLSFPCSSARPRSWSRSLAGRLTLAVHPDGVSHPTRAGMPGDIRELCPGDQAVFQLSGA
jgi:hypothetical protein